MQINRLEQLLQLLERQPGDPFLIYAAGFEYEQQGKENEALEYYRKIVEEHPSYLPVYYQYGLLLSKTGKQEEALKILEKGVELAQSQKNQKTLRELREAIQWVEEDD